MDSLTRTALIGTAHQTEVPTDAGRLCAAILEKRADLPLERRTLLAAGARAVEGLAGHIPRVGVVGPPASPEDTLPECSPKAARILADLIRTGSPTVLREGLSLLVDSRQRMPHWLIPDALSPKAESLRDALRLAVGERGRWVAALNPAWRWASEPVVGPSFEALVRMWHDASPATRKAILRDARALDPDGARQLLEAAWSKEKADDRAGLLAALSTNLTAADEAFVQEQLRDRAQVVRDVAQRLLGSMPASAFGQRMRERADAMVGYKPSVLAFVGKTGTLLVTPRETIDDEAAADGLARKPPDGLGVKAYWLVSALGAVPPQHWTTRFNRTAEQIVATATENDWAGALAMGWTTAALLHRDTNWLCALWTFWQTASEKSISVQKARELLPLILQTLPPDEAARRIIPLLDGRESRIDVAAALRATTSPWPAPLAKAWLTTLRREVTAGSPLSPMLVASASNAATALPRELLADAATPIEIPEGSRVWATPLTAFTDTVRVRFELFQEIAP